MNLYEGIKSKLNESGKAKNLKELNRGDYCVAMECDRRGYAPSQVIGGTLTVGELVDYLSGLDQDMKIVTSHDDGYTYGAISTSDFRDERIYEDDDDEDYDEEDKEAEEDYDESDKLNEGTQDSSTIKLSNTYKVIDVPKGHITATPSIAREINSKNDDKIWELIDNYESGRITKDEVIKKVTELNNGDKDEIEADLDLIFKESEKLNEGAKRFAQVGDGKYAKEVFNKLVDEATYDYGHDPYNGTISTTHFGGNVIKIADTYSKEADVKAKEYIEKDDNGEKWVSRCLDLGELPDQPGVHRYVFYGWAAI